MTKYIKTGVILFLICAVCTALCAIVNEVTAPVIALSAEADRLEALSVVSRGYEIGEQMEGNGSNISYVIPLLSNGEIAGYILQLETSGYGGAMTLIASYSADGTLLEAQLMANSETPGLGKNAEQSWYMDMFRGKGGSEPLPLTKSDLSATDSAAVSGASITFAGISSALNSGSNYVKSLGGYSVTQESEVVPVIENVAVAASGPDMEAVAEMAAGYEAGEAREGEGAVSYVVPLLSGGEEVGYVLELEANGFGGPMVVMAAYGKDGTVLDARLLYNSETPGFGKVAEESWYMDMFKGKGGTEALPQGSGDLTEAEAEAVAGATVTFSGVSSALIKGSEYVKGLGGDV